MKIVFMGTPEFAVPVVRALGDSGHSVLSVFTQPDKPVGRKQIITATPVKLFAIEHGIPVLQPAKLRSPEARAELEPLLRQAHALVVAAYGRILPEWILNASRHGAFNVHSSLLPKYRGAAPINWAIANGETTTGITIMKMDAGLDTGPILLQERTRIGESETAPELTARLSTLGADLMVEALRLLRMGRLEARPQDDRQATLAPILKREDGLVDWNMSAAQILCRLRGFTPFPGCYTTLNERRLELVTAHVSEASPVREALAAPGTIVKIERDSLRVQCGDASELQVTAVQPEGKRSMPVRDFLNGANLESGTQLG